MKYFLHDTNAFADEKVTKVFMKYGYEGVGLFFCVLEKLAFQEKPIETKVLKKQMFINPMDRRLNNIWKFLIEVGLLEEQNGETFNHRVMNVSDKYVVNKDKHKKRMAEWRANKGDDENVTCHNVITTPVTEHVTEHARDTSKEKKTKESKENDSDDVPSSAAVVGNVAEDINDTRLVLQAEARLAQEKDNIITSNISLKHDVGIEELKAKVSRDVRFCFEFDTLGVPVEHLEGWLGAFNAWLEYTGETVKQERDYRAHFKSWLLKQPYKSANPMTYDPAQAKVTTSPTVKHDDAEEVMRKRYG